jgi:hypothetical protein
MAPIEVVLQLLALRNSLRVVGRIQEERHRAITKDDVEDILTVINKKHNQDNGTWAFGDTAIPSERSIDRYFDLAADKLNVTLTFFSLVQTRSISTIKSVRKSKESFILLCVALIKTAMSLAPMNT